MRWDRFYRVGADGKLEEVDVEQLTLEMREADHAVGPKEGSRDWRPCKCGAGMRARSLYERDGVPSSEGWDCPACGTLHLFPIEHRAHNGLTRFEWSRVRHLGCNAFGHGHCLPDVWLDGLRVEGDRVGSDVLGWFDLGLIRPVANPPPVRPV
jgi:hypothetical protein